MLIVVSGLPGTGKTVIAERAARMVNAALVSKDIVEAALVRSGIGREQGSGSAAYEVLFAIAKAQLAVGTSVVVDSVLTYERLRARCREIAARHRAEFKAIECVCSDPVTHRARLDGRTRGIPGWYELSWKDVQDVAARYEPWTAPRLLLDAMRPVDANLRALRSFLTS